MAITVKHAKTSTIPDGADTDLVRPSDWNADHTLTGLGTMAEQNANNVAITGGSINGTSLGATTAASAKVTTLDIASGLTLATDAGTAGQVLTSAGAGSVPTWTSNGTGDVVGPASATDNAIARFDTTTGKLIQNSVVTVGDTGAIAGATSISNINYVDFDTTYATTLTEGQLGWDGNNTLGLGMIGGNVIQHIGEDQFFYCKASSAITKGQVIMFTGAVGASGVPTGAPATGITDGAYIMGVAAESIALNGFGLVQSFGTLRNVNTTGFADGDILWYDPAVTGGLTKTKPSAPNVKVQMAAVINGGSSGGGTILIRIDPGSTLGGTDSNAQITSPTAAQIITYASADGYWKNTSLTAGTGISINNATTGVVTVTNSAPDQTVAISAGTGISVSGTYPNFTVTNTSPSSGGTVTSVTGTAPIASSGGNTPAISISQATTSTDGYLSSTDWNTFNSKGSGTVTSVGGTGSVNGITLSGTVTSSGNLTLGGTLSNVDLATQVTGTLPAANGGTGITSPGTSGNVLTSNGSAWVSSAPTAPSTPITVNQTTVSSNFTISSGQNGFSVGPMTIASGVSVTVATGQRWVVI